MRLNKFIASCGVCSRRDADKLIASGRVTVNDVTAQNGMNVENSDKVFLDGKELKPAEKTIVLAYYKPVGVTCTERDVHAERTVIQELNYGKRVTYAGRLDKDSEGLLLLSNDGDLINAMMKGANHHEKEYEVVVDKDITDDFIYNMTNGVFLSELGVRTRQCKVSKRGSRFFNIVLTQGLNRQIRRMCSELGYDVVGLKRIRIMDLKLEKLKLSCGEYVELDDVTIDKLKKQCSLI
ncbi:MAG: rRNA pseudouridine synthase [Butyrivibrio sp.]|nr:rRNA pseudouridine synthase [Butyrivibrio sp.]